MTFILTNLLPVPPRSLLALNQEEEGQADYESSGMADPSVTGVEVRPDTNGSTPACVQPAVNQFPPALLDQTTRQRGGLLLHILLAVYMFIGLAIVCEDYFVPSLTRVSDGQFKVEILKVPNIRGICYLSLAGCRMQGKDSMPEFSGHYQRRSIERQ